MSKKIIRLLISIIFPASISAIIMLMGAILISKAEIGEGIAPFVSVVSTAVSSILTSYLLSRFYNIKNIYCVLIAVLIFTVIKIFLTLVTKNNIVFNLSNLIDILFIVVFSFVGALMCSNSKK